MQKGQSTGINLWLLSNSFNLDFKNISRPLYCIFVFDVTLAALRGGLHNATSIFVLKKKERFNTGTLRF